MKLRARITRKKIATHRILHLFFPPDVKPFMRESILKRNLGSRPYSECTSWEKDGSCHLMYSSRDLGK